MGWGLEELQRRPALSTTVEHLPAPAKCWRNVYRLKKFNIKFLKHAVDADPGFWEAPNIYRGRAWPDREIALDKRDRFLGDTVADKYGVFIKGASLGDFIEWVGVESG